jgi:hypothetical protein
MLKIADPRSDHDPEFDLDVIARERERESRMLVAAREAEVADYIDKHQQCDEDGHALVARDFRTALTLTSRVTLGSGTVEVPAPRVNEKRVDDAGVRQRFTSEISAP